MGLKFNSSFGLLINSSNGLVLDYDGWVGCAAKHLGQAVSAEDIHSVRELVRANRPNIQSLPMHTFVQGVRAKQVWECDSCKDLCGTKNTKKNHRNGAHKGEQPSTWTSVWVQQSQSNKMFIKVGFISNFCSLKFLFFISIIRSIPLWRYNPCNLLRLLH